jgi:hypothetical protein
VGRVSAQIITALRARADQLRREAEYRRKGGLPMSAPPGWNRDPAMLHLIADEFTALADTAEGHGPPLSIEGE